MAQRKGIILAGGSGTRLFPITHSVSKQLLPIYDKPMIYYPLTVLMLANIREVAIITMPEDQVQFQRLLSDGSQWGMEFTYIVQQQPEGLAQAYLLAEEFLAGAPSAMILGDNIFFGHGLPELLHDASYNETGGTVFAYQVSDPGRYGVVDFDENGTVKSIIEKPEHPASNFAVTGLYFLDGNASKLAAKVEKSHRGELEITSLLELYLDKGELTLQRMGRGYAWLDTGTHDSLLEASEFVRTVEKRQGLKIGCPEEIAFRKDWISKADMEQVIATLRKTEYGQYLERLVSA